MLGGEEIIAARASAADQADAMAKAVDAAIPRACMVKAHSGKVAATRHVGEGGQVLSLGAADRWASTLGKLFSGSTVECANEALFDLVTLIVESNGREATLLTAQLRVLPIFDQTYQPCRSRDSRALDILMTRL